MEAQIRLNHELCEVVYTASLECLKKRPELAAKIEGHIRAYAVLEVLIPQPIATVFSDYDFLLVQSLCELRDSLELAVQGFYNHAFASLRSVLELGILGLYFSDNAVDRLEARNWLESPERTAETKQALVKLLLQDNFREAESRFGLATRIRGAFDELGGYVHIRRFDYDSTGQRLSDLRRFSESAFIRFVSRMERVVADLVFGFLVKHPIGVMGLPMIEKFGLDQPLGLALDREHAGSVKAVLKTKEVEFLEKLCSEDSSIQQTIQSVLSRPNLTEEDIDRQEQRWDAMIKEPPFIG